MLMWSMNDLINIGIAILIMYGILNAVHWWYYPIDREDK